jgi:hypothetical protein
MSYLDNIIDEIKKIDIETVKDIEENITEVNIIEKSKIYFWIRLFIKNELDFNSGDTITINWNIYDEKIDTKFLSYGKKGLEYDYDNQITQGTLEDDKKILVLMVDSEEVNYSKDINHLRTLFKLSHHYQENIIKHDELDFLYNDNKIEYYDLDI